VSLLSKNSSVFSFASILSLRPESLSSTCFSLLQCLSTVFFSWFMGIFISRISAWYFVLRLSVFLL
jgi:hypothetical protein